MSFLIANAISCFPDSGFRYYNRSFGRRWTCGSHTDVRAVHEETVARVASNDSRSAIAAAYDGNVERPVCSCLLTLIRI